MTRLISAVMVVTLVLSVAPVLAGDAFHALSRLPSAGQGPPGEASVRSDSAEDLGAARVFELVGEAEPCRTPLRASRAGHRTGMYQKATG